jgi:hypothetical protein
MPKLVAESVGCVKCIIAQTRLAVRKINALRFAKVRSSD